MTDTEPDLVEQAVAAAVRAFPEAIAADAATRGAWLRAIADALDAHSAELVELADDETRLGPPRLTGEVARTTGQLRFFAEVIAEGSYLEAIVDHAVPSAAPPRPDLRRVLRALGPVAVFSASNFPFAFSVAGGDTASALAVGCPVIVKAHPGHPRLSRRTAELVARALTSAGAPAGLFALIEGVDAGLALVEHPSIKAVAFTGSVSGGRALQRRAAERAEPIPFFGELGSINPVVVTAAADAARGTALAAGLAGSFQLGAGQFCTKPGVVLLPRGSALEAALPAQVGSTPQVLLTDSISEGFHRGIERLSAVPGVEVIAGAVGSAVAPVVVTADADVLAGYADALLGEVFGPVTVLIRYRDEDELRIALGHLEGSLTATLHSEPSDDVAAVLARLEQLAGRVLFSGWPTGVAVSWAQHHGGPWPSTTSQHTSVGATALRRFLRPIAYQDAPDELLPAELQDANPLGIPRRVDGRLEQS